MIEIQVMAWFIFVLVIAMLASLLMVVVVSSLFIAPLWLERNCKKARNKETA